MDPTEHRIRQIVTEIAGLSDVPADADLYLDLGVASVHALQMLGALEEQFHVQVPDDEFVEATSITRLTAMMNSILIPKNGASLNA